MSYRSFVTEQSRAGDPAAQRALHAFIVPVRERRGAMLPNAQQCVSLDEVRARLAVIRDAEEARYEHAQVERKRLQPAARPPKLEEAIAKERRIVEERVADATRFTEAEHADLVRLGKERRSWNPFVRRAAEKEGTKLRAAHDSRYSGKLDKAMHEFDRHDVPRIEQHVGASERIYRQYVKTSLDLEAQMRGARRSLRTEIPKAEGQLKILERAGALHVECNGAISHARLDQLAGAVGLAYQALPHALRRDVEHEIRREQRAKERLRESMSIER